MTSRALTVRLTALAAMLGGCSSEPVVYLGQQEDTSADAGWWHDFDAAAARRQWQEAFRQAWEENCLEPRSVCLEWGDARFDSVCEALGADHEIHELRPCCDEPDAELDYAARWYCAREENEP